jgi:hypothetical protein
MVKQLLVTGKIVDPGNCGATVNFLGFQLRKAGLGWQSFLDQSIFKLLQISRRVAAEPPALRPNRLTTLQAGTQLAPGVRVRWH